MLAGPVIDPAAAGARFTVTGNGGEGIPFPQMLLPKTVIFPETADVPKSTVMLLVPAPVATVAPGGKLQRYTDVFGITGVEYATPKELLQTLEEPVIFPAADGKGSTVIFINAAGAA